MAVTNHRHNLSSRAQETPSSACKKCSKYQAKLEKKDAKILELTNTIKDELIPLARQQEKDISFWRSNAQESFDGYDRVFQANSKLLNRVNVLVASALAVGVAAGYYLGAYYQSQD